MKSIKRTLRVWSKTYGIGFCELPECRIEFTKRSKTQKFCSTSHKWKAWDYSHPRLKKENHDGTGAISCDCFGVIGTCIQKGIEKGPPTLPLGAD